MSFLIKIVHLFLFFTVRPFLKFFFNFKQEGQENIKGVNPPIIIVANHSCWIDPFLISAAMPPDSEIIPVRFATWYKHFWKFAPIIWPMGAFPVRKKMGLEKTLEKALNILKKGGTVGMFPEEKRRHFGRRRKGRRGTPFLAIKTNALILPVFVDGTMGMEFSDYFMRARKITIKIGKPFRLPSQPVENIEELSELNDLADLVVEKIYELE